VSDSNVVKLNALRRLSMKPHAESNVPGMPKEYGIRVYDGDFLVGCVGWRDLQLAMANLDRIIIDDRKDHVASRFPVD
jgi:hypothetical protein